MVGLRFHIAFKVEKTEVFVKKRNFAVINSRERSGEIKLVDLGFIHLKENYL